MNKEPAKKPQTTDDKLDEALEESFPASDPPSMTDPVGHVGTGEVSQDEARGSKDKK